MSKTTVSPSHDVEASAKGDRADTGTPVQPKMRPAAPDQISFVRKPSPQGPGMNGPQASSVPPGVLALSPMAANLKASTDDGEGVLDRIIADGVKLDNTITSQLRTLAPGNVPDAHGMASARARQPTNIERKK